MSEGDNQQLGHIKRAVRPLLFRTSEPDYPSATNGGTATIIQTDNGRVFALYCQHSAKSFQWQDLLVSNRRSGGSAANLQRALHVGGPIDHAVGSDLLDIAVVELAQDPAWFTDAPFLLSQKTVSDCRPHDKLVVFGFPTELLNLALDRPKATVMNMKLWAHPRESQDIVLRHASCVAPGIGTHLNTLSGFSGSPVARESDGRFCGIVVRGGVLPNDTLKLSFVEGSDILHLLTGPRDQTGSYRYDKEIPFGELPPGIGENQ